MRDAAAASTDESPRPTPTTRRRWAAGLAATILAAVAALGMWNGLGPSTSTAVCCASGRAAYRALVGRLGRDVNAGSAHRRAQSTSASGSIVLQRRGHLQSRARYDAALPGPHGVYDGPCGRHAVQRLTATDGGNDGRRARRQVLK